MTLLTPVLAIAGACAILIPILIHLLMRQRRRPVEWAAMRFLIEAFKKHKRRLQLEQLLLLAVRCRAPPTRWWAGWLPAPTADGDAAGALPGAPCCCAAEGPSGLKA